MSLSGKPSFNYTEPVCLCAFARCAVTLLPLLQVIAGLGAPLVWQLNTALFPSVTVWSDGGDVNVGAAPRTQ